MKIKNKKLIIAQFLLAANAQEFLQIETDANTDKACVAPGICTPPDTKYQKVAPIIPRA